VADFYARKKPERDDPSIVEPVALAPSAAQLIRGEGGREEREGTDWYVEGSAYRRTQPGDPKRSEENVAERHRGSGWRLDNDGGSARHLAVCARRAYSVVPLDSALRNAMVM